jgi:hypothetical protein
MADFVVTNAKLYFGGYDLTGYSNSVEADITPDMVDNTCMGDTAHSQIAGLGDVKVNASGYQDIATIDAVVQPLIGVATPLTVCPQNGDAGSRAYLFTSMEGAYKPLGGAVGDLCPWSAEFSNGNGIKPSAGYILFAKGSMSGGPTASTPQLLGAVGAAQRVRASLHVFAAAGTTLDVIIESDTASNFPSATTQLTFAQATGISSQILATAVGAITDTYWRITYTSAGGAFTAFVAMAIETP